MQIMWIFLNDTSDIDEMWMPRPHSRKVKKTLTQTFTLRANQHRLRSLIQNASITFRFNLKRSD